MKDLTRIKSANTKTIQWQVKALRLSTLSVAMITIFSVPVYAADSSSTPVQVTEPAPVLTVAEPIPAKVNEPAPAQAAEPTPAQVSEPAPVQAAEPIPAQASRPVPTQTSEPTLDTMTISAKKSSDPHTKTELGKLTEYTPISGAVVSREEVEHLQLVNNLLELGKRVPGISLIRNMRIPDGGKLYTENRIDGMRASATNTSSFDEVDMANIERIEVITGPASALYGSGAFGGTINMFTRQPPKEFSAGVSQEAGSWGFTRTQANIGSSFMDGRFGFIITGSSMDNDGWRLSRAPGARNAAAEHKDAVSIRPQFRLTDSTTITLGYSQLDYDFRWAGPVKMANFNQDWRLTEAGTFGQYIDEYTTKSFRVQQMVGDHGEFTLAQTRLTDYGLNNGNGGSGGANNVICDYVGALPTPAGKVRCQTVNAGAVTTVNNTIKQSDVLTKTTQAMYRHDFDLAKSSVYIGAEEIYIKTNSTTWDNAYTALQAQSGQWAKAAMTTTGQGSLNKSREITPFVHLEFSPLDQLRFHVGERFSQIEYNVDDRTATNKDVRMTRKGNVQRTGVTYEINKNHLVWANRGETFNPQSTGSLINSAAVGTAGNVIGATLEPERGVTKEVGFRGLFEAFGLRYDVAFYKADSKGFGTTRDCTVAERAALNGGATCTLNEAAGGLGTRGVESVFSWAVTSWLDLGATHTHSRAYYTNWKTTAFDYTGRSYQSMPLDKINLRIGVKPAPGWLVELEGDHISSYYLETTNLLGTYSRPDIFNLRASYRSKDWSYWLHALNLTNQKYATRAMYSTVAGVSQLVAQAGQGNSGSYTPLNLRAGISYKW
jgi:iron complex outermembrane receptor protein